MGQIKKKFVKWLTNKMIIRNYKKAGKEYGEALSYCCYSPPGNLLSAKENFEFWEKEYKKRGFRPINKDSFIRYGGYDEPLIGLGEKA